MKVSQRNYSFDKHSYKKPIKRPQQIVTKLNNQIQSMQQAIKTYNESDQNSLAWKKKLNMPTNPCQLKKLTQPKFQHILLESNFVNMAQAQNQQNNINDSFLRNSIKKSQLLSKHNMKNRRSDQLNKISKAASIHFGQNQQNCNSPIKSQQFTKDSSLKFNSFHEQVSRFDKLAYLSSRNSLYDKNYSTKRHGSKAARISIGQNNKKPKVNNDIQQQQSSLLQNIQSNNHVSKTLLGENEQQKSIINGVSTISFYNNNSQLQLGLGFINDLRHLPITQQRNIPTKSQYQTQNIRNKIQQKTSRLQREWVKTQCYRQKFNITESANTYSARGARKSVGKLATIISKIENRRPSTSISSQRKNIYSQQLQRQNTQRNKKSNTIDFQEEKQLYGDFNDITVIN